MMISVRRLVASTLIATTVFIAGCGGGSDSADSSAPGPASPIFVVDPSERRADDLVQISELTAVPGVAGNLGSDVVAITFVPSAEVTPTSLVSVWVDLQTRRAIGTLHLLAERTVFTFESHGSISEWVGSMLVQDARFIPEASRSAVWWGKPPDGLFQKLEPEWRRDPYAMTGRIFRDGEHAYSFAPAQPGTRAGVIYDPDRPAKMSELAGHWISTTGETLDVAGDGRFRVSLDRCRSMLGHASARSSGSSYFDVLLGGDSSPGCPIGAGSIALLTVGGRLTLVMVVLNDAIAPTEAVTLVAQKSDS